MNRAFNQFHNRKTVVASALVFAILALAVVSLVEYQHYTASHVTNPGSSTLPRSESGSASTITSTTTSATRHAGTSYEFIVRPCNCSVDLSQKAWSAYDTLGALAHASDTIVVANVTSEHTVGVNDSVLFGKNVGLTPVTEYNVTVDAVLAGGSGLKTGVWLIVAQIGGTLGRTTMNVTAYPTLYVGHSYVFFLATASHIPIVYNGFPTTTGGSQGLFYVQDGKVYSLDNMYPQANSWLPIKAAGVPLPTFVSEVQASLASSTSSSATG